jgi:POT family proton-dependent oligopeptide transporter
MRNFPERTSADAASARNAGQAELFGHPRGLPFLFATETWERFSYYGMRALLVLYMVKHLLDPARAEHVLGLAALHRMLESMFGPLPTQPFASQIYGFYTGLVYLTPIIGGLMADRVLGQRRTVLIGAALMAAGHFMMAFEPLFLIALTTLILGNGAFKPNISTQVGALYAPGDPRRDRAFSIFYVGINLGAFFAPLVCGTLGEEIGWHFGFAAAGVGMTIALAIYLAGTPNLPPDVLERRQQAPLTSADRKAMLALAMLVIPASLFWATYEQQGNTIPLWADNQTDRTVNLLFASFEIPVTWFQAFNPFMIFAFTPLILVVWRRQGPREPTTLTKMAIGSLLNAAAWLVMAVAAYVAGGGQASWLWLFAFFAVITVGELYLSPTSLSFVTKIAPARVLSLMMGLWLASNFLGNFLAGYLGTFWSSMSPPTFFIMLSAIAALAGGCIMLIAIPVARLLKA